MLCPPMYDGNVRGSSHRHQAPTFRQIWTGEVYVVYEIDTGHNGQTDNNRSHTAQAYHGEHVRRKQVD